MHEGGVQSVGQSWGIFEGMDRLIKSVRTDLGLTSVELCHVPAFVCAGMNVSCTCVCTWTPILLILSPFHKNFLGSSGNNFFVSRMCKIHLTPGRCVIPNALFLAPV